MLLALARAKRRASSRDGGARLRIALGWLAIGCSSAPLERLCSSAQPIVGARDEAPAASKPKWRDAVGALRGPDGAVLCSAVEIAPGWVMTARHCAENSSFLSSYATGDESSRAIDVIRTYPHHELDVMLVALSEAGGSSNITWPQGSLHAENWVGRSVMLTGFGEDETATRGVLRWVEEEVSDVDDTFILVDGRGQSGACAGDSGGPLFAIDQEDQPLLLGILSKGSASCQGTDYYVRSDLVHDWVVTTMEQATREPCAGIPAEGACRDGGVVYCEDGRPVAASCTDHTLCGWSESNAGYRCLSVDADPCRGVGTRGACEGDVLLRCDRGRLVERECEPCTRCVTQGDSTACL